MLFFFAMFAFGSVAANAQPQSTTADQDREAVIAADSITINPSARALATAVERLEKVYGVPITYEDTKYVAGEVGETTFNSEAHKTIKRHIPLSFRYEAPPSAAPFDVRKKLAEAALTEAIQNYNSQLHGEIFTVSDTERGFHVVARNFIGASGSAEEMRPLLDTPVTIPSGIRTVDQLLAEICKEIPGLSIGIFPVNLFAQHHTTVAASNLPARTVLDNLVKEIAIPAEQQIGPGAYRDTAEGGYLSWELRTDPDPRWGGGALSFTIVKPPGTL